MGGVSEREFRSKFRCEFLFFFFNLQNGQRLKARKDETEIHNKMKEVGGKTTKPFIFYLCGIPSGIPRLINQVESINQSVSFTQ